MAHTFLEDFLLGEFSDAEIVAIHDHLRDAHHLLRHFLRHKYLELHVVVVFYKSQLLHVFRIVGEVVDGCHRTQFLESLNEHSFWVEVCEPQRADHFFHAMLTSICFNGIQQRTAHLQVVDEVYPSEPDALALPFFIGLMVDDGSHSAHQLSVFECHEVVGLTEVEGCVFLFVQRRHVVAEQGGNIVFVTLIQVVMEFHEPL